MSHSSISRTEGSSGSSPGISNTSPHIISVTYSYFLKRALFSADHLLPFDRGRGLAGDVVDHPSDLRNPVRDQGRDFQKVLHGERINVRRDGVQRSHRPKRKDVAVPAHVPGDAD